MTIATMQSLGCLPWSAGLLVAGCLPRLSCWLRFRLGSVSSGRVSTRNCIHFKLQARSRLSRVSEHTFEQRITGPVELFDAVLAIGKKGINVQRYKGLGEMNPMQLRETTMNPDTRRLVQLTIDSESKTQQLFDMLLAKKRSKDRKAWLEEKGDLAETI